MYFYHFTNIENALGIIEKGWIFGRHEALENNLMQTENASPSVISVSQNKIKEYARLYFRPRTPTQYHNDCLLYTSIEKRSPCEQIGVSVEKNKKGYIIECWINPYKEVIGKEYSNFINEIIKYLKDKNMVAVSYTHLLYRVRTA